MPEDTYIGMCDEICPICHHPMDDHSIENTSVFRNSKMKPEDEIQTHMIVCQVPGCKATEGIQGLCFSSVPDEFLSEPKISFLRRIWLKIRPETEIITMKEEIRDLVDNKFVKLIPFENEDEDDVFGSKEE